MSRTVTSPRPVVVPGRPPRWQRRLRRHRQVLAAVLAAVVVGSLGAALRPPAPATRDVVVATSALAPGTRVDAGQVALEPRAVDTLATDAVTSIDEAVGRTIASPVLDGEPLRQRDVVAPGLLSGIGAGLVATPVHLADDAVTALVRPGDLVDVVASRASESTGSSDAYVVAERLRVITSGGASAGAAGLLGSSGADSPASLLVLATTTTQALELARAAAGSRLTITLRAA